MKRREKKTAEDRSTRGKGNLENTGIHDRIDPIMQRLRLFHVVQNSGLSIMVTQYRHVACRLTMYKRHSKDDAKTSTLGKTEDKNWKSRN